MYNCENEKYLANLMDDSEVVCDKIIDADAKLSSKDNDETKAIPTNFNEKNAASKTQHFYILLAFLLLIIPLLIAVSIYCYLIKKLIKTVIIIPLPK